MKKKILLVLFCSLCATVTASAQAIDDYVYVTDVISSNDFSKTSVNNNVDKNSKQYYLKYTNFQNSYFTFDQDAHTIITKSSILQSAYLKKITTAWYNMNVSYQPSICVYGKNTVYDYTEFTDNNPNNDGQEITTFTLSDRNDLQQEFTIETPRYQYVAIKKSSQFAPYFTSISLTWQLFYERTSLTAGTLGTLCLPYGIKAEDMDGITAYSIAGKTVENDVVTSLIFDEVDHIEAGKPYIFVANSTEIALKYHGEKAETPINENGMYGVYERHPFADDASHDSNYYVISNNIVQAASKNSGVNANCVYIRMNEVPPYNNSAQSSKRALIITSEGFTQTDVTPTLLSVPASSSLSNNAVDLSGRRVAKGTAPTISIINGKKILAR